MIDERVEDLNLRIREAKLRMENAQFQAQLSEKVLKLEEDRLMHLERLLVTLDDVS